jgi:hypothetical protein
MTRGIRSLEIVDYDFEVPVDYYPIPLHDDDPVDSTVWAQSVVQDVATVADDPGLPGSIVNDLAQVRVRLLGERNPRLVAAVSVRPENYLSIGALVTVQQLTMQDDDDGPETFEMLARGESTRMSPGARSRELELWRSEIPAGQLVGLYQRIEFIDPGDTDGRLSQRTVFAVFPPRSRDMVQFTFTCEDFGAFSNMRQQTQAIVSSLSVETART